MKFNKWRVFIPLMLLAFANLSCLFSTPTVKIERAQMTGDGDAATTSFSSNDTFFCSVTLSNAPEDTTVKAVWTAVNADGMDPNLVIDETEIKSGSGTVRFRLENSNSWPQGEYKVDILLNGEIERTIEFLVQ